MTINSISCLSQVASFLKIPAGKITVNANSLPVRITNNSTTTGFIAIIFQLLKEAISPLHVQNLGDISELRQWLEYAIVKGIHSDSLQNSHQIFQELNSVLNTKTYLVSDDLSIADVVLYYILYPSLVSLVYLDKEKYLNVSRWFDHLQQDPTLRQKNKMIDFSTNYLTAVAPARH